MEATKTRACGVGVTNPTCACYNLEERHCISRRLVAFIVQELMEKENYGHSGIDGPELLKLLKIWR